MPHGVEKTKNLTFAAHLQELRQRLLLPVAVLVLASIGAFMLGDQIIALLQKPLNKSIYYTSPAGGFSFIFQVAVFGGFIVALPVFMHQLIKFVEPAMARFSRRTLKLFFFSSITMAIVGIACGYLISLPSALHFLNSFENQQIQALISADQYLKFVLYYLAGFAVLFQLPVIMLVINKIKPQKPGRLMRYQKHVVVTSFIAAAVLTPTPDVINQLIFAVPMIALYQVSVVLVWFVNRRHKPAAIKVDHPVNYQVSEIENIPALAQIKAIPKTAGRPSPSIGFDIIRPQ